MPTASIQRAFELALQHHHAGRLMDAEALYREILAVQPDHADARQFLGVIAHQLGRHDLAVEWLQQAIVLSPNNPGAYSNLGEAYRMTGRMDEAIASYRRALRLQPDCPETYSNLGLALAGRGWFAEAIAAHRRAIELRPDDAVSHYNLGNALKDGELPEEAMAAYHRALALKPEFPEACSNLGNMYKDYGQIEEAVACYRRAIAWCPDFADAHLNLGIVLLLLGRYEEGWHEYEWRWRTSAHAHLRRNLLAPAWNGQPATGRTILVHAEQGFGDTLLFVRYLPFIRSHLCAARVILECQPALVPLLKQLHDVEIDVVARGASNETLPPFDLHLPLLDLPAALQRFAPVNMSAPYLQAQAGVRTQWRERLGSRGELRVGLAWSGNPLYYDDRRRSIAPGKLASVLRVPGIRFVSLQVEPRGPLPAAFTAAGVLDFTADIANFSDSAALMAEMNLIITVDTATAHLAGALGRPVWVLLPFVPDWRWGLGRDDTPWYPTMRLFRQTTAGDWEEVLERVTAALRGRWDEWHTANDE